MVRKESGQFIEIYEGYEGADDTFHFPFAYFPIFGFNCFVSRLMGEDKASRRVKGSSVKNTKCLRRLLSWISMYFLLC